jgi:hypothetical protein
MRVISWNILASEWIKSSHYPKISKKVLFDRKSRFARILLILKKTDADSILLQEVMLDEYASIKRHFAKTHYCSPLISIQWKYGLAKINTKKPSESGNMTLCRRSMFPKSVQPQYHALNFGVYTELPHLSILNIHLDDLSAQTRHKQMRQIDELLYKKPSCIIGGDFNQPYKINSKLYDLPEFKVHNNACPTSYHYYIKHYYYIKEQMNIDNILTRGLTKKNTAKEDLECMQFPATMEKGIEIYGSDHLPVIIDIL